MTDGNCMTFALAHFFGLSEDEIFGRLKRAGLSKLIGPTGMIVVMELKALVAIGETFGPLCQFVLSKHPTLAEFLDCCDNATYLCTVKGHALTVKNKRVYDCLGETASLDKEIQSVRREAGVIDFFTADSIEDKNGGWVAYNGAASLMR